MTHLDELNLESFEYGARDAISMAHFPWTVDSARHKIIDLACQIRALVRAIRADGLDSRHHPERDALSGLAVGGDGGGGTKWTLVIDHKGAEGLVHQLHERGYKIVKETA